MGERLRKIQNFDSFDLKEINEEMLLSINSRLKEVGYGEKEIFNLLDISDFHELSFPYLPIYIYRYLQGETPLNTAVKLFMLGYDVTLIELEELFSENQINFLLNLGILHNVFGKYISTVNIFPCLGMLFFTDHLFNKKPEYGNVYYLGQDSYTLARGMLKEPVESTLDLCTGSGVQGILASRFSKKVTGVDINPRAVNFARFNAVLNNVTNVEFKLGDLYKPVGNKKFDMILANPPFVPSPLNNILYRDGSKTGENIVKRIVENLPRFLNENGICQISTLLVFADEDYNKKLSKWLESRNFTVLSLFFNKFDVLRYVFNHLEFPENYHTYRDSLLKWYDNYKEMNIDTLADGLITFKKTGTSGFELIKARLLNHDFSNFIDNCFKYRADDSKLEDYKKIRLSENFEALHIYENSEKPDSYSIHYSPNSLFEERQIDETAKEIIHYLKNDAGKWFLIESLLKEINLDNINNIKNSILKLASYSIVKLC